MLTVSLNVHLCSWVCIVQNKSYAYRVCGCVCVSVCVRAFTNSLAPSVFHQNVCFRPSRTRDTGRRQEEEKGSEPCWIPISPAHWGRTVPKILGLRWSLLHPLISNSQSLQSYAIQIISNGVKQDGFVQHAELFQYTARWLLHTEASGTVKLVYVYVREREGGGESLGDFHAIIQMCYYTCCIAMKWAYNWDYNVISSIDVHSSPCVNEILVSRVTTVSVSVKQASGRTVSPGKRVIIDDSDKCCGIWQWQ